jgi:hypothetical protein
MTLIVVLAAMIVLAALAPYFGADSRGLSDHPWERMRH